MVTRKLCSTRGVRISEATLYISLLKELPKKGHAAWLDEAVPIPGLLPVRFGLVRYWSHQRFWDGHEHVDLTEESANQVIRLANFTTTFTNKYARRGLNWAVQ